MTSLLPMLPNRKTRQRGSTLYTVGAAEVAGVRRRLQGIGRRPDTSLTSAAARDSNRVVRCLAGDLHVVRMRFSQAGSRDANEIGVRSEFVDIAAADVAHAAP